MLSHTKARKVKEQLANDRKVAAAVAAMEEEERLRKERERQAKENLAREVRLFTSSTKTIRARGDTVHARKRLLVCIQKTNFQIFSGLA